MTFTRNAQSSKNALKNKSTTQDSARTTGNDEQTSLSDIIATLEQLTKTVNSLKTKTTFEDTVKEILLTLTNQVKFLTNRNNNVSDNIDKVESDIARCDQYSRRNTVVVTGLDFKSNESHDELTENVASEISKCGIHVAKHDFSACHRNSNRPISVTNDKTGKTTNIPPSVTVRFYDSYKKDTILHKYRNYEHNKPKKVRVYQSLNNYYTNLKKKITSFCLDNEIEIRWIHWRSQSSGFCVKVSDKDESRVISKIFSMGDFTQQVMAE